MNFTSRLHSHSLDAHPQSAAIKRILSAALDAADPARAVRRGLARAGNLLRSNGHEFNLDHFSRLILIAVGKAAPAMAAETRFILSEYPTEGIVVTKHLPNYDLGNLQLIQASHPLPDSRSLEAGEAILRLLAETSSKDLVIFLISGGGSALMTVPMDGISLTDMAQLTSLLLGCGARIDEVNTLRRILDRVKGGGLARAAFPAKTISLLLSDVVDSPLEAIASGPTVPNPTSCADALSVLAKYDLLSRTPTAILEFLQEKNETNEDVFLGSHVIVVGSNLISAQAAQAQAEKEGFNAKILTTSLQGEASQVGRELAKTLRNPDFSLYSDCRPKPPFCLIAGGETTVSLGCTFGLGGRNQEVALAAVDELSGLEDVMLVTLATDGDDGPTDAAGAVVTGETLARAKLLRLNAAEHLHWHDAYPFFNTLDDLLKPNPTGTNVNDLTFLFAF